MRSRAAAHKRQPRVLRLLDELIARHILPQVVGKARLAGGLEAAVQDPAPDITIDQQRPVAAVREREGEVGGEERLPVARTGAGDRDEQRSLYTVGVDEVEADTSQRLDHLGRLLVPAQMWHRTQDRQ